jgi:cytochrome c-type biogenesis protein
MSTQSRKPNGIFNGMTISRRGAAIVAGTIAVAVVVWSVADGPFGALLEMHVAQWLNAFSQAIQSSGGLTGPRLYFSALIGGLIASLSPCILGLLPLNLSYIGASSVRSRPVALRLATLFVLGVATTTMIVGLISSLFFAVFVSYRGQVNIIVGAAIVVMAIWMMGFLRLRIPGVAKIPAKGGPYVVGLCYALVATPCASPVLVAVLGAASVQGRVVVTIAAMALYALGYTIVLWLASVFAGIVVTSRRLLEHGELITRLSAAALLLLGIGFVYYGLQQL